MALKITTPIGTDKGITSEAYLRIVNYVVSKTGSLILQTQLFLNEEDAAAAVTINTPYPSTARNQQISEQVTIPLTKTISTEVTKTRIVPKEVQVEKELPVRGEDGAFVMENGQVVMSLQATTEIQNVEEEYTEVVDVVVPDLTLLEGQDIFEFAYSKLKERMSEVFGAENLVDC